MAEIDHQIGDVVCVVRSGRQMLIVDLPPGSAFAVLAWKPSPTEPPVEAEVHLSALVPVRSRRGP